MTEKNEERPSEELKPDYEKEPELREISEEELKQILEDHKKWLESDEKEAEKADLSKANLKEANLSGVNLQNAILTGANLQKAKLNGANLQANLQRANLQEANLFGADLKGAGLSQVNLQKANLYCAILQNAHFADATLEDANLAGAQLQEAFLSKANLQKADLSNANLEKADLSDANLEKAILIKAELQKANITRADMKNTVLNGVEGLATAELKYADLEGAMGLLGNEFAQADVTGAKLPDDIKEFKALENVKETSQNARKIFFAMLLGCVYSWLTIATTTDVRLLTNTASSPLPIIQTEIPIAWFYIAAPLVLICLYFYFHLYLDNLWKGLAGLPAIFPDGKPLDQTAYPWLLNSIVRRHFKRLKPRPLIAHMKEWITIFLAWWVVPITMIAFWLRYIPRHDWLGTCLHIGLISFSFAFAIIFYRLCALTLQGKEKVVFTFKKFWGDRRFYYGVSVMVVGVLFSLVSYGAIEGVRIRYKAPQYIKFLVPRIFEIIGYDVFADFREKDVSEKPTNYWEIDKEERLESVKGANLQKRNLKNADMYEAFLVKADLREALLNSANLQRAKLHQADLRGANLIEADLEGADVRGANLERAKLKGANLKGTNLWGVNNLTVEQLSEVSSLYDAQLDFGLDKKIKKDYPHLLESPR